MSIDNISLYQMIVMVVGVGVVAVVLGRLLVGKSVDTMYGIRQLLYEGRHRKGRGRHEPTTKEEMYDRR